MHIQMEEKMNTKIHQSILLQSEEKDLRSGICYRESKEEAMKG